MRVYSKLFEKERMSRLQRMDINFFCFFLFTHTKIHIIIIFSCKFLTYVFRFAVAVRYFSKMSNNVNKERQAEGERERVVRCANSTQNNRWCQHFIRNSIKNLLEQTRSKKRQNEEKKTHIVIIIFYLWWIELKKINKLFIIDS